MDAEISESLFSLYLDECGMNYQRHYKVHNEKNVDFKIETPSVVLCDVKEVRNSRIDSTGEINAYKHIRKDISDLRKKFKTSKPTHPVVLITMNFSKSYFTGATVAQALLGDMGVEFQENVRSELHHLSRSNAALTKTTNTSISGVLVFDCASGNHKYFINPFAQNKLPTGYFPEVEEIKICRGSGEKELVSLAKLMFWEREE